MVSHCMYFVAAVSELEDDQVNVRVNNRPKFNCQSSRNWLKFVWRSVCFMIVEQV